jgi:hypothetical protein
MNRRLTTIAAGLAFGATALLAQVSGTPGWQSFQEAGTLVRRSVDGPVITRPLSVLAPVSGSPFSATEERRTTQTLSDGTVLDTSESTVLYRDNDGRTRTERTVQGKTTIMIVDPVAHTNVRLDPSTKAAWKATVGGGYQFATPLPATAPSADKAAAEAADRAKFEAGLVAGMGGRRGGTPAGATTPDVNTKQLLDDLQKKMAEMQQDAATQPRSEDLGMMHQNGVPAQGTRTTLTIPVGQIGNSREIKVVNERWYSADLQMTVKSINSDPRFGTTTYELKNIQRTNPDASLFQIPPDYTVMEGGGRRGAKQ